MKFLCTWKIHEDKRMDALGVFSQMTADDDKAEMGEDLTMIGRWHNLANFTGAAIIESDNAAAVGAWALNWAPICNIDIVPVLDDAETRAVGKKALAAHTAQ
jgi:hypothetical protein